MIMYLI